MSTKTRNKVRCYCKACNGKLVDERTRNKHAELESRLASVISGFEPALLISNPNTISDQHNPKPNTTREIDHEGSEVEQDELKNLSDNNYEPVFDDFDEQYVIQKKRRRQDQFREPEVILDNQHDEISSDESFGVPVEDDENESDIPSEDDIFLSDDELPVEQFTAPDFNDFDYESDHRYIDTNIDFNDSWILL